MQHNQKAKGAHFYHPFKGHQRSYVLQNLSGNHFSTQYTHTRLLPHARLLLLGRRTQSSQEPRILKRKDYAHIRNTTRNSTLNCHWGDMYGSVETQRRYNLIVRYHRWVGEKEQDISVQAGDIASSRTNQSGHQMGCVIGQLGQVPRLQAITIARRWLATEGGGTGLKGIWPLSCNQGSYNQNNLTYGK